MKKPNIEVKEFGAMGPDGFEIVINGNPRYTVRTATEVLSIIGMIDAFTDVVNSFEGGYEAPNTLDSIEKAKKALKKAGCV